MKKWHELACIPSTKHSCSLEAFGNYHGFEYKGPGGYYDGANFLVISENEISGKTMGLVQTYMGREFDETIWCLIPGFKIQKGKGT